MFDRLKTRLGLDITPENLRIRAEQMNTLIASRRSVIGVSMLLAALMVWLMWGWVDYTVLLVWLGVLYLVHLAGFVDLLRSPKTVNTLDECKRWQYQLLRSYLLVGAIWGSTSFIMLIPESLVQQAFLVCILIGMTAGGVAGNPTFLLAQQGYAVLIILPLLISLLLQNDRDHLTLAAMVGVFLVFILKSGRDQCRNEENSIRRRFENSELLEGLKRANEQLKVAQHAARAGGWDWDIANGRMHWSDELFRLFGLDPRNSEATIESWRNVLHPADSAGAQEAVAEALRKGIPLYNEYRIVLPDGSIRWIVAQGDSTRNERGETVRMVGLCMDISEQKEAQRRAVQAETRFHTLVEHAGTAFVVHDLDGRLLEVNRQACDLFGYGRGELLGMALSAISPNIELERARSRWMELQEGVPQIFNATHRRKDGTLFPAEVRLSIITLDDQKRVVALINDITERERFERELQRSEERYRLFAEKMPLGITVLQDGHVRYVNQAIVDLIGYSQDELLQQPFSHLIHQDDRAFMVDLHRRRMMGEDVPQVFVVRMLHKDGSVRKWEMHSSTTEWDGKRSSLAIVADITERVAMEEALRDSLHQLEEKELAKTRFLAAAGHDLRQPVAAANLFLDALKLVPHSQQQDEIITRLDQSMKVFSDLLERLLDISRFDAGLVKPQLGPLDIAQLFVWLEQNFAENAHNRDLDFRVFFPLKRELVVRTDIGLLQSVLMNLVSNAIKYTSHGGILVSARPRGEQVLLQVWDSGCGIAKENLGKIFDEFYQVSNPQRNREAGLGLGLSIAQRAMALLGGRIVCRSQAGRGSVFELMLPLDRTQQQIMHLAEPQRLPGGAEQNLLQGKRVVVLEDDSLVAEGLVCLLNGHGASVIHFSSAEEALQGRDVFGADYFVVDFALGAELTGIAFLGEMQKRSNRRIRGVVVTGETSSHFIEGISGLSWPVLHKPVSYAKLVQALKQ